MKRYFVLSAIGQDRPGIVADVSELIYECSCNLEDSRMTLLGTHFALLILLSGEGPQLSDTLNRACKRLEWDKGLTVFLSPLDQRTGALTEAPEPDHEVRVVGLDRAGIVYRTSALLASKNVNIVDLRTHIEPAPESGSPVFTMVMAINLPAGLNRKALRAELEQLADQLNVEISLHTLPVSR
jgi:glycine cleavage system transcriptional repressor